MSNVEKTISCPTCQRPVRYSTTDPFRPFCSERCRLIDLGSWASEDYKIPATSQAEEWEKKEKQ